VRAMASSTHSSSDVLLREFTHRVKNEFASAIQVVSFAAEKSADRNVKVALEGVMEKLHDYASVHRALQMPSGNDCIDASTYLRDLCGSISRSKLENKSIELVLVDRPFRISSERCWLLGMIIAELITNAARHAFDQRGGTVRIECRPSGEFVECFVSDNGSASTPEVRPGSGLRIIDALAQKLDADFQFNFGQAGSEAVIILPIDNDVCLTAASLRRAQTHPAHAA
jgi:two-component sensor histidine kinase